MIFLLREQEKQFGGPPVWVPSIQNRIIHHHRTPFNSNLILIFVFFFFAIIAIRTLFKLWWIYPHNYSAAAVNLQVAADVGFTAGRAACYSKVCRVYLTSPNPYFVQRRSAGRILRLLLNRAATYSSGVERRAAALRGRRHRDLERFKTPGAPLAPLLIPAESRLNSGTAFQNVTVSAAFLWRRSGGHLGRLFYLHFFFSLVILNRLEK